jgi:hypothetical protein
MRLADRLPSAATLSRRRGAIGGFATGVAFPLLLAGLVLAMQTGGLSDGGPRPQPVDWIYAED